MKRKIIFRLIAVLLPVFLVMLFELTLRIGGYGQNFRLFAKVTVDHQPDYLVMNSRISKKYFQDYELGSDNQSDLFLRKKTKNTFRVFVQGASTAAGFPFYRSASFPRLLKHRLAQTFPEKNIEVVNTGITAVNSYTLLDLSDQIIDQKPDLVIIYAGHNEYYGALGVGSTISFDTPPGLIKVYLYFKNFRFFQLLENGYKKLRNPEEKKYRIGETTLMEIMAKKQRIPYESEVYYEGIEQFRSNMGKLLNKYKRHRIPVILSTVVSNERDVKPFLSDSIENEQQFLQAVRKEDYKARILARNNANAAYITGRYYLEQERDTASKYLHLAKELDFLRFRAPEKINEVIVQLAGEFEATLVDMEGVFSSYSLQGIIGNELLTEHVHPNVKGSFLMADAFYNEIRAMGLLENWEHYMPFDEAFKDMPVTEIDSIQGKYVIDNLKKSWPYVLNMSGMNPVADYIDNPTYEESSALDLFTKQMRWQDVMKRSYYKYERDSSYDKGLQVAQSLILEYPEQGEVYRMAGNMCLKMKAYEKAVYYFYKCDQLEKNDLSKRQLAHAQKSLSEAGGSRTNKGSE